MSDLRNKIAKRQQRIADKTGADAWLRLHGYDTGPRVIAPDPVYRCEVCQRSHHEVRILEVRLDEKRRHSPTLYFCEEHVPDWEGKGWKRKP